MGLLDRSIKGSNLHRLLKDAPITYKLNDKGNAIRLFGQSFYRNDPTETILNPEHTSVILYGHNGKNLYGIYGDGVLETDKWNAWTDRQFDNKDIVGIHVSPFYTAKIKLRIPEDMKNELTGIKYTPIDQNNVMIEYTGPGGNSMLYIPYGSIIVSIEAIQSTEKEYFGCIKVEPTAVKCKCGSNNAVITAVILAAILLALVCLLYRWFHIKETIIIERPINANIRTDT